MASKNSPVGGNLEQIQAPKSLRLPETRWTVVQDEDMKQKGPVLLLHGRVGFCHLGALETSFKTHSYFIHISIILYHLDSWESKFSPSRRVNHCLTSKVSLFPPTFLFQILYSSGYFSSLL